MKRYRVMNFDFDTRAMIVGMNIEDHWEDNVKELWKVNIEQTKKELELQYGKSHIDLKIKNLVELGSKPFSIIAFHNVFLTDCRDAFIIGAYYPALTGACVLGERILNHLVLALRDEYKHTPEYKKIYRKDSFDRWGDVIDILCSWGVFNKKVEKLFRNFVLLRNKSIHFNPETDINDRELALEAVTILQNIVSEQFSAFGAQEWFIDDIPGEAYIKMSFQDNPFIKSIYLPNCTLVGYKHRIEFIEGKMVAKDEHEYEDKECDDEEFAYLRRNKR